MDIEKDQSEVQSIVTAILQREPSEVSSTNHGRENQPDIK